MDIMEECIKKMDEADELISKVAELLYNEAKKYEEGKQEALLYTNAQVEYIARIVNSMRRDIEELRDVIQ